jgi:hypothetical protein
MYLPRYKTHNSFILMSLTSQTGMESKVLNEAQQGVLAVSFHIEPSREDIERRAFQIYMACGSQPGNDIADWLAAEKELREAYWREHSRYPRSFNLRKAA